RRCRRRGRSPVPAPAQAAGPPSAGPPWWPASSARAAPSAPSPPAQYRNKLAYAQTCVYARFAVSVGGPEWKDMNMRAKGIAYDTGFLRNGTSSRQHWSPEIVRRELEIIRDDLHCTAVQITGGDADRIELAGHTAAELGLEVWISPYPLELTTDRITELVLDCAERAERIRASGAEVVLVAGVELSVMNHG